MTDRPETFLFDMDGLLLDSEQTALDALQAVLGPMGYAASGVHAFFLTLVGSSASVTSERLAAFIGDARAAAQIEEEWRANHAASMANHVPVKPTVRETLEALTGQGASMGVVTSTAGNSARHHLKMAGLLPHFDVVVGGDEVLANKPDPAPYLQAAAALGVAPTACAAFEDSDRGITAAVRAGCRAVQVPDLRAPSVPLPDLGQHVAQNLWEAVSLVRRYTNAVSD